MLLTRAEARRSSCISCNGAVENEEWARLREICTTAINCRKFSSFRSPKLGGEKRRRAKSTFQVGVGFANQ